MVSVNDYSSEENHWLVRAWAFQHDTGAVDTLEHSLRAAVERNVLADHAMVSAHSHFLGIVERCTSDPALKAEMKRKRDAHPFWISYDRTDWTVLDRRRQEFTSECEVRR